MASADSNKRETFWLSAWYEGRWWLWLLWPLSLLFRAIAATRRRMLSRCAEPLPVAVIVVGNITLGGTGKTPLIIALVQYLKQLGLKPGVLSRGYGGLAPDYPYSVTPESAVEHSGDEPLLIATEGHCPVVVGPDRVASAHQLVERYGCNILLSDDGMQHYKLSRQWEICTIDGSRGLGNGLCLPAGPLREPGRRLNSVDAILINGPLKSPLPGQHSACFTFRLEPAFWCNLLTGQRFSLLEFRQWLSQNIEQPGGEIAAVTGIGNPERFFHTLRDCGLKINGKSFADHHPFSAEDLAYANDKLLLMTAKDAIKCHSFAKPGWWYLGIEAEVPLEFQASLSDFLNRQGLLIDQQTV